MPPDQFQPQTSLPLQPEKPKWNFWETDPKRNFAPWFLKFLMGLIAIGLLFTSLIWYQAARNYKAGLDALSKSEEQFQTLKSVRTENPRTDWKTYINEEYGFEFLHPFSKIEMDKDYILFDPPRECQCDAPANFVIDITSFDKLKKDYQSQATNLTDFIKGYFLLGSNTKSIGKYTMIWGPLDGPYDPYKCILPTDKEVILFTSYVSPTTTDKILSTFKFVEPLDTSTWKIYQNNEYGFEIKYPSDWWLDYQIISNSRSESTLSVGNAKNPNLKCDVWLYFDSSDPHKENRYTNENEKKNCDLILNTVISTFKFTR